MASSSKQKTTMAKRDRENRLRERRALKKAKKDARKLAAHEPDVPADAPLGDAVAAGDAVVPDDAVVPGDAVVAAHEAPASES